MTERNKYDYSLLISRIKKKYGTMTNFAKAMECSKSVISMRINNNADWHRTDVMKAVKLLDIPETQVYSFFYTLKVEK